MGIATMQDIEKATQELADNRELLTLRLQDLHDEIEQVKRRRLPDIKAAAGGTANAKAFLHQLIDDNRGLFAKPKTLVISGIKIGLKKGTGSVEFDDEEMVIRRIERMFTTEEQREIYIKVTKKVKKKALQDLEVGKLKKLGVTVEGTSDVVVIKAADSDVDKLVGKLLDEAEGAEEAERMVA